MRSEVSRKDVAEPKKQKKDGLTRLVLEKAGSGSKFPTPRHRSSESLLSRVILHIERSLP